jgi:hypothetical protein
VLGNSNSANPGAWRELGFSPEIFKFEAAPVPDAYKVEPQITELYPAAKKAFKKAFNAKFDEVLDSIHDNAGLNDIDYAYSVFGVSLNVKDNSCKKYIYRFLEHLKEVGGETEAAAFEADRWNAYASELAWKDWYDSIYLPGGKRRPAQELPNPLPAEPVVLQQPAIPWKELKNKSDNSALNYNIKIRWAFIREYTGHGRATKPDGTSAKIGELFWREEADPLPAGTGDLPGVEHSWLKNRISLTWQVTADYWKQLLVVGMTHHNEIYQQHSVVHTAQSAMSWTKRSFQYNEETEEYDEIDSGEYQESPFIFPLHEAVYRRMSMKDATQMATACCFLVLNSYSIQQVPWWASDWFRVFLIVLSVAIAVVAIASAASTGGASLVGAGKVIAGLLGGGAVAGVVGALANIVIGVGITWLLTKAAKALFGDTAGTIVGGILGLLLGGFIVGGFDPNSFINVFSTPQGWMALSTAVTDGVSVYLNEQLKQTLKDFAELVKDSNKHMKELQEAWNELYLKNRIDPASVRQYLSELLEKPEQFLTRTLMTGSDIVDVTLRQIDSFAEDRLQLSLP